ncbi:MAG: hypothetical protein K2G31_00540, partial [Clostridia bacterium]|nr:hypothetical protein [Clostridia bacterium]
NAIFNGKYNLMRIFFRMYAPVHDEINRFFLIGSKLPKQDNIHIPDSTIKGVIIKDMIEFEQLFNTAIDDMANDLLSIADFDILSIVVKPANKMYDYIRSIS